MATAGLGGARERKRKECDSMSSSVAVRHLSVPAPRPTARTQLIPIITISSPLGGDARSVSASPTLIDANAPAKASAVG
ncbi:hypothetical protein HBH98_181760 [Parastagonospora nodorum]|nr:hypothetical protein HBH54_017030 [Parastagonospora nodorum]KAH3953561.1 hypothetical protein HBH53_029400 [Parastagonospora nodorum]KAH3990800.1 hypothetical protein HBH52_006390 [Parastagonospora nodorum]KAH4006410.1 hypothetical protein HBI10_016820 [Parastagonospora nodorum]KAH4025859.1 hypothetical protein HBI13_070750 [Parastagonospora nodorum]